jgi:hypothetical protein
MHCTSPPGLSESTRMALFVLGAATDAGFQFRIAGQGQLEILGPQGVAPTLCEPTLAAIRSHGAEIQRLLRWFAAERRQGRYWNPPRGPRARQ